MKRISTLFFLFLFFIASLLFASLFLPSKLHVEKSIVIKSPVDRTFEEVAVFQNWEHWSPWKAQDPSAVHVYGGQKMQVGASMHWKGNPELSGEGSNTILEIIPYKFIKNQIVLKDYGNKVFDNWKFTLVSENETKVTWAFDSEIDILWRLPALFSNWENSLAPDMECGLRRLKQVSEKNATELYSMQTLTGQWSEPSISQ